MKCNFCGSEIPEGSNICFECGAEQKTDLSVTVKDLTINDRPKCIHCGSDMPDGATVCYNCGQAQVAPVPNNGVIVGGTQKSKKVAAILALLLGTIGVHDFYLGNTKTGIIKVVLGVFSGGVISGIWSLIDFVRILTGSISTDALGNPLL